LANQSIVQHLFQIANNKNSLHFVGAQVFHRQCQGAKVMEPLKNTQYVDFEVNWPDLKIVCTLLVLKFSIDVAMAQR